MHITVVPGGSKTAAVASQTLLDDPRGPTVRAVFRDPSKAAAPLAAHPRFTAVRGDIGDAASLDFSGSDAVLLVTPSRDDGYDVVQHAREISENVKAAIKAAGSVKRLVLLSSMGAQYGEDVVGNPSLFFLFFSCMVQPIRLAFRLSRHGADYVCHSRARSNRIMRPKRSFGMRLQKWCLSAHATLWRTGGWPCRP